MYVIGTSNSVVLLTAANFRSGITVFAPLVDGEVPCKIWSPQFISYAGYEQPDGSVIGDPANVEITKICQRLGITIAMMTYWTHSVKLGLLYHEPQELDLPPNAYSAINIFKWKDIASTIHYS